VESGTASGDGGRCANKVRGKIATKKTYGEEKKNIKDGAAWAWSTLVAVVAGAGRGAHAAINWGCLRAVGRAQEGFFGKEKNSIVFVNTAAVDGGAEGRSR